MLRVVAVLASALAFTAPTALAMHAPGDQAAGTAGTASPASSSTLEEHDARLGPKYGVAPAAVPAAVEVVRVVKPGGFAWQEFVIGVAAAAAVAFALLAAALWRQRRVINPVLRAS